MSFDKFRNIFEDEVLDSKKKKIQWCWRDSKYKYRYPCQVKDSYIFAGFLSR